MEEAFREVELRFLERAQAMSNRVLDIAGEIFELELPSISLEADLAKDGEFWFKLGEPAADLEMFVRALVRVFPKSFSRRLIRRKWEKELSVLFDRHCGRARYDFCLRIQKSFDLLRLRVMEVVDKTVEKVEEAVRMATEEKNRSEMGVRDRLSRMDQNIQFLEDTLGRLKGSSGSPPNAPTARTTSREASVGGDR